MCYEGGEFDVRVLLGFLGFVNDKFEGDEDGRERYDSRLVKWHFPEVMSLEQHQESQFS